MGFRVQFFPKKVRFSLKIQGKFGIITIATEVADLDGKSPRKTRFLA